MYGIFYFRARYLFWSDWGRQPRIERSGLDGSNRIVIVFKDLFWPNALTIDYPNKRLYFADARMNFIDFCDYDGLNRYKVFGNDHVSNDSTPLWCYLIHTLFSTLIIDHALHGKRVSMEGHSGETYKRKSGCHGL